jgi:NAD(P)-binding Rossmann-like domain
MPTRVAIEVLKSTNLQDPSTEHPLELLHRAAADKNWSLPILRELAFADILGPLFGNLVLRDNRPNSHVLLNYWGKQLGTAIRATSKVVRYTSSASQNQLIDSAVKSRSHLLGFPGRGAGDLFPSGVIGSIPANLLERIRKSKVTIVGAGPSGAMVSRTLIQAGFPVEVLDKRGEWGGIWSREEVHRARNNPKQIDLLGYKLAPGPGTGKEVLNWTTNVGSGAVPVKRAIKEIRTSSSGFELQTEKGATDTVRLLVNCCGIGEPAPLSVNGKMTTVTTKTNAGHRWQKNLTLGDVKGKSFCMVGLGNSTMEMLIQLQAFQNQGVELDYSVLTHYPEQAIREPWSTYVDDGANSYRVFRDLGAPDLTSIAGDLDPIRTAYMRALNEDRIIGSVTSWHRAGTSITKYTRSRAVTGIAGATSGSIVATHHYTLTGYKWPATQYAQFGIGLVSGHPKFDYDGELHDKSGDLAPGYFGMGPVLETPTNRNAVVIPGNVFRMGDMLFGMIVRALELTA